MSATGRSGGRTAALCGHHHHHNIAAAAAAAASAAWQHASSSRGGNTTALITLSGVHRFFIVARVLCSRWARARGQQGATRASPCVGKCDCRCRQPGRPRAEAEALAAVWYIHHQQHTLAVTMDGNSAHISSRPCIVIYVHTRPGSIAVNDAVSFSLCISGIHLHCNRGRSTTTPQCTGRGVCMDRTLAAVLWTMCSVQPAGTSRPRPNGLETRPQRSLAGRRRTCEEGRIAGAVREAGCRALERVRCSPYVQIV